MEAKKKIQKTNSIKIHLHLDNYTGKQGKNQIYLRVYYGKTLYIRTGKAIAPKFWDQKKKVVKNVRGNFGAGKLIGDLNEMKAKLRRIIDATVEAGKPLSKKKLETALFQMDVSAAAVTLREVFDRTITEDRLDPDVSARTVQHYINYFNKIDELLPGMLIEDLTQEDVMKVQHELIYVQEKAKRTTYNFLTQFKKAVTRAQSKWGLIDKNPFAGFKLKKHETGKREYLNGGELQLLHDLYLSGVLEDQPMAPNQKYSLQETLQFFLVGCYTGLRYNDLRKLNDREAHFKGEVIRIFTAKGKKWVTIPVLPQLRDVIEPFGSTIYANCPESSSPATYNSLIQKVMEFAKIPRHITAHCSRHTFACVALEVGISLETIQAILGHSDIRDTQIYAKIQGKTVIEEMAKFGKLSAMRPKTRMKKVV